MSQNTGNEFASFVPLMASKNNEYNAVLAHGGETSGAVNSSIGMIDLTAGVNLSADAMVGVDPNPSSSTGELPQNMLQSFAEFLKRRTGSNNNNNNDVEITHETDFTLNDNNNNNNNVEIIQQQDFTLGGKRKLSADVDMGVKMSRQENEEMSEGDEVSSSEEDENVLQTNFDTIAFPSKREIVAAEIFPLNRLEQNVTYAIIKGTPSLHAFVDKNGKERSEPSILLRVAKEGHFEDRFTVRAYGVA